MLYKICTIANLLPLDFLDHFSRAKYCCILFAYYTKEASA